MIETVIFATLFLFAYLANKGNTYALLVAMFAINMTIYPLTSETTVVFAALLDATFVILLLFFADKHKFWQAGWMMFGLICHIAQELDQIKETNVIFSNYEATITAITIMQLLGGSYGLFVWVCRQVRLSDNNNPVFYHSFYPINNISKAWPIPLENKKP